MSQEKKQRFPKPQEQSQPTEQSNTKLSKHDMKRSKRRNHAQTVKECPDSSTGSNSDEDYAYSVKIKGNSKTKTIICNRGKSISLLIRVRQLMSSTPKHTTAFSRALSHPKVQQKYSLMVQTNLCLTKASFKQPQNQINDSQIQLFTSSKEAQAYLIPALS